MFKIQVAQPINNLAHNAQSFTKQAKQTLSTNKRKGSMGDAMNVILGGFIVTVVAIYLVSEGREVLGDEEEQLDSIDVALFGVVFIVLIAGIALAAWSQLSN